MSGSFLEYERAPKWFKDLAAIIIRQNVEDAWDEFSYRGDLGGGGDHAGTYFRWTWEGHSWEDHNMIISWDDEDMPARGYHDIYDDNGEILGG